MKILVINWRCPKNPEMGGAEIHMFEIFKRVAAAGHDVTLVSHKFPGASDEEIMEGIKIIRTGNKFLFNRQFKNYYRKHLTKENFDLVVDDISKIPLFTPKYITKPLVGIIHHIHGKSLFKEIPKPVARYIIRAEKFIPFVYRDTPLFAVSPSTKEELIQLGQPENKIDILYNAIDHDLFDKISVQKSEQPAIAYIGRIKRYKNIEAVIDVLPEIKKTIPDILLKIGGTGDHLPKLKEYVESKNLQDNVRFLGYLSEEDKAKEMGRAWIFVTMALKEGWGITVLEANATGTPVVGSDVPGLRDSIKDGETGRLVDIKDRQELAEVLTELLTDKEKLKTLSGKAKEWAKKFSWDNSAAYFLEKIFERFPALKEK